MHLIGRAVSQLLAVSRGCACGVALQVRRRAIRADSCCLLSGVIEMCVLGQQGLSVSRDFACGEPAEHVIICTAA